MRDILRHILLAQEFAAKMDRKSFHEDARTVLAVIRCLEVVSEASRRLPEELKERYSAIPWRQIAAAGNIYRHDYEDVTADVVWDTVAQDRPPLRTAVELGLSKTQFDRMLRRAPRDENSLRVRRLEKTRCV